MMIESGDSAQRTVLVVDDDPFIVSFIESALEDEGYLVLTTGSESALRIARDHHPDVILLDIMMPGLDGVEVSRLLRSEPITASIPIIVMSAQDRLRKASSTSFANDKLPKPFDLDQLFSIVARWTRSIE